MIQITVWLFDLTYTASVRSEAMATVRLAFTMTVIETINLINPALVPIWHPGAGQEYAALLRRWRAMTPSTHDGQAVA